MQIPGLTPDTSRPVRIMSQKEYWKTRCAPPLRFCVLGGGIVCLAVGVLTIAAMGGYGLVDGLLMLGLGWGICVRQSRACAVVAGAYYALNQLLLRITPVFAAAASEQSMVVYVFLGLLILSIYGTFTFHSNYTDYVESLEVSSGIVPKE